MRQYISGLKKPTVRGEKISLFCLLTRWATGAPSSFRRWSLPPSRSRRARRKISTRCFPVGTLILVAALFHNSHPRLPPHPIHSPDDVEPRSALRGPHGHGQRRRLADPHVNIFLLRCQTVVFFPPEARYHACQSSHVPCFSLLRLTASGQCCTIDKSIPDVHFETPEPV